MADAEDGPDPQATRSLKSQDQGGHQSCGDRQGRGYAPQPREVSIKAHDNVHGGSQSSRTKLVVHLLESHSSPAVQAAAAPCKAALWASEHGSEPSKALLSDFTWTDGIGAAEAGHASTSDGPAVLLRPSALHTLLESGFGTRSLLEKSLHDASVGRMIKSIGAALPASSASRAEKLASILTRFACLVSETLHAAALKDLAEHNLATLKRPQSLGTMSLALTELLEAHRPRLTDHTAAAFRDWLAVLDDELVPALTSSQRR